MHYDTAAFQRLMQAPVSSTSGSVPVKTVEVNHFHGECRCVPPIGEPNAVDRAGYDGFDSGCRITVNCQIGYVPGRVRGCVVSRNACDGAQPFIESIARLRLRCLLKHRKSKASCAMMKLDVSVWPTGRCSSFCMTLCCGLKSNQASTRDGTIPTSRD